MKYLKSSNANSVSNVMDEIKDRKVMLAIYNLKEGHLDCASGPTHPMQMEMKYSLTKKELKEMRSDSEFEHALLAYDFVNGTVTLLASFPALEVASVFLLSLTNAMLNGDKNEEDWLKIENQIDDVKVISYGK